MNNKHTYDTQDSLAAAVSDIYADETRGFDDQNRAASHCIAEAFAAWMTRPLQQPTIPPQRPRRVWRTGRRK